MKIVWTSLSNLLLIFGFFIVLQSLLLVYQRYNTQRLAFTREPEQLTYTNTTQNDFPRFLQIDSAGISVPVFSAKIENHKWDLRNDGVMYLSSSALPGNKGNSIMYGHNWNSLLGNLHKVKPTDTLVVGLDSGTQRKFIVEYVYEVSPSQVDILDQVDYERLTIYTCSGFLDSKRLVVVARTI